MFDQMFVDRASIGDIVCELSKHYKQLVCYVYDHWYSRTHPPIPPIIIADTTISQQQEKVKGFILPFT